MPNWCNNGITLRHADPAMIQRAAKALQEGNFLQEFIPCPQELLDAVANFTTNEDLVAQHGYSSWYDFNIAKWGTKWDVNSDNVEIEDANTLTAAFDSAWAPPTTAMERLTEMGFTVKLYYYEPGMAFAGIWEDGIDSYYEYSDMSAAEVAECFPKELDEMFCISESMAEWEAENAEDEENIDIDLDGGLSSTNE